ncbi:hypothetical protein LOD99_4110 [Oopsacas minuta]|uniref:Uncharacterized protein n=1 Tax=Oopsacas minuta TaxID=111878 RepID=A0AAV7JUV5_9METZ|nr:hypothetical protein LOD99_4110 [Oopsacas minuta]
MTTAARPTFEPARGGRGKGENDLSAISKQYSSRDMPAQLKLKTRQPGQDTQEEIMGRDLRKELELKEMNAKDKSDRHNQTQDGSVAKSHRVEHMTVFKLDADDISTEVINYLQPFQVFNLSAAIIF